MSTTRVTVDVPDELLARARALPAAWGTSAHSDPQARLSRLVVNAAPVPVEVTITLTPEEADELRHHEYYGDIEEDPNDSIEDRVATRASDALRKAGYAMPWDAR